MSSLQSTNEFLILIPTYNERKNITILLKKIDKLYPNRKFEIVVIDDKSPDGTADEARQLKTKHKVHIISAKKDGLGSAYLRGFRFALENLKSRYIVMMDADLSHDPKDIGRLIETLDSSDLAIGSRYVKGGAIKDWDLRRRMISRFGNIFARLIAGIYDFHDVTAGFKAIKTELAEKIFRSKISPGGYAFQLSMLSLAKDQGANISEIPIVFKDRIYGHTKLTYKDISEFLIECLRIRLKNKISGQ